MLELQVFLALVLGREGFGGKALVKCAASDEIARKYQATLSLKLRLLCLVC